MIVLIGTILRMIRQMKYLIWFEFVIASKKRVMYEYLKILES